MSDFDEKPKRNKLYMEKSQSSDGGEKGDKIEDAEGKTATEDYYYVNEAAVNDDKATPWKSEDTIPKTEGSNVSEKSGMDGKARPFVRGEISDARISNLAEQFENMQQATSQRLDDMRNDITNLRQDTTQRLSNIETRLDRIFDMFAMMMQQMPTTGQFASADIASGSVSLARGIQEDRVTHGNAAGSVGMQSTRFQSPPNLQPPRATDVCYCTSS